MWSLASRLASLTSGSLQNGNVKRAEVNTLTDVKWNDDGGAASQLLNAPCDFNKWKKKKKKLNWNQSYEKYNLKVKLALEKHSSVWGTNLK